MSARPHIPKILPEIDWDDTNDGKRFEFPWGQFRIVLSQGNDYDEEPSDLGKGVGKREAKAGDIARHSVGYHEYEYFRPATTAMEHYRDLARDATSDAEIAAAMVEASRYVHQDYKRWEDYNRNEWCYTGVKACIHYQEVKLADSSVWGVESDSDGYEKECAWEQLYEAIDEAIASLKRLRIQVNGAALLKLEALMQAKSQAAYEAQRAEYAAKYPQGHVENQAVRVERQPKDIPDYIPQKDDEYRTCEICGTEITTLRTDVPLTQHVCTDCFESQKDCPYCRKVRIDIDDEACEDCWKVLPTFREYYASHLLYTPNQFEGNEFHTAEHKAWVVNQLICLINSGFDKVYWNKDLYNALYMSLFGHIAHYDMHGFWGSWFDHRNDRYRFIRNIVNYPYIGSGSMGDVESAIQGWVLDQIQKQGGTGDRMMALVDALPQLEAAA